MTTSENPRAALDEALEEMRSTLGSSSQPVRLTAEATVACAEALSLLVDAQLAAVKPKRKPEAEPEPEPYPRESLPDDTPVGHGWVMGWGGEGLFRPEGNGSFTRWLGVKWGALVTWEESELEDPRPATVGDLRRVGLPVTEWPDIETPEPEPEPVEPPDGSVVLVNGEAWQRLDGAWSLADSFDPWTWAAVCRLATPTVIYTPKEAP